ncbi:MAG: hypothetical protein A3F12_00140 [Gammaproteobacteria bacterium RIFCSPHIGHO2_12_FULL_38_14]|nr:MAG: hypothetical protein A3F12_00140 [Gammaproteobacteria bacterium RIFCSPHIGHO2_12_FULL_38_14]
MRPLLIIVFFILFLPFAVFSNNNPNGVAILVYHDVDAHRKTSMTLATQKFEAQMAWIKDHGYTVIPLQQLVEYLQGKQSDLPKKSVVITADDGWKSVYTTLAPITQKYHYPVTLFIYPAAISDKPSSWMTWDQLKTLQKTGLFDVQSHTYWHPNFKIERRKRSPENYQKFVNDQLVKSKNILEEKLGTPITLLAWPFGIYNDDLENAAEKAHYTMAFTIGALRAKPSDMRHPMAVPRYMIIESQSMPMFARIVSGASTTLESSPQLSH